MRTRPLTRRPRRRFRPTRSRLHLERLESRTLLTAGHLVKWTMDDDGILGAVANPADNIGQVGQPDPPIRLEIGDRCLINTADWYNDPLEIIAKGPNALVDTVLLAQDSPTNPGRSFASGARSPGSFQNDPAVNFVDDQVNHTVAFTLTPALANAMEDPAAGLTPGYRCGNPQHRDFQRGDFIITSGAPVAKEQQAADGVGNSFATAGAVTVQPDGSGSQSGTIQVAGNQDMYRLVAPTSGRLTVGLTPAVGGTLQPILFVYDHAGRALGYFAAGAAGEPVSVQLDVVQGQSYFVQAAGFTTSTGAYDLTFATAPTPAPFPGASIAPLDDTGVGSVAGTIGVPGQVDHYYFVAPVTGRVTIRQDAAPGSALDSQLSVYDQTNTLLASDDNGDGGFNSRVQVDVVAGRPYLVEASGRVYEQDGGGGQVIDQALSTGAYQLTFTTQDFGSTFDSAQVIPLSPFDTAFQTGALTTGDQHDVFRFAVPVPSPLVVVLSGGPGRPLQGTLSVFDASGNLIGSDTNAGKISAEVPFPVTAPGQTYYAEVSGLAGGTGGYTLIVTEDDREQGDRFDNAATIDVSSGFGMDIEAYQDPGDTDYRRFTPSASGLMRIQDSAIFGTPVDTTLAVFDGNNHLLAGTDDNGSSTNSEIVLPVTAGTTYYVRASGVGNVTGEFLLTLALEKPTATLATAPTLDVSSGAAAQTGYIGGSGDADLYRFTAPRSGPLPVEVDGLFNPLTAEVGISFDPSLIPRLDGQLTVLDANGNVIAQDDDSGSNYNSFLVANAVAGQTYYVRVNGFADSAGAYELLVGKQAGSNRATADPFPLDGSDAEGPFDPDLDNPPDPNSGSLTGRILFPGDEDWFHLRPTASGPLEVVESVDAFSNLNGKVSVYDAAGNLLGSATNEPALQSPAQITDAALPTPARVLLNVTAGQDYYVEVQAEPLFGFGPVVPGPYTLNVATPPPNSTPFAAQPLDLSSGMATASGNVNVPGDQGWFVFRAPVTGTVGVLQSDAPGSFLINDLLAFDRTGAPVVSAPSIGFGQSFASLQFPVTAGQTYLILAAGFQNFTGADNLTVSVLPSTGPQLRPTDLTATTPEDIVNALLGADSGISVVPGSISYAGAPTASGVFAGGTGIVGFESGALLTTGSTADVVGDNYTEGSPGLGNGQPGNADLDQLVPGGTHSAAVLSFDFIPTVNVVQLSYVFASSEYSRFEASPFDDVFGAFVNGVDYARVPGTGSPAPGSGDIISVNTVNRETNAPFFIDNSIGPTGALAPLHTQMNGLTTVLTLRAPVIPGQVNHIELAIANAVDPLYTSAVFLEGGGFRTAPETVAPAVGNRALTTLADQAAAAGGAGGDPTGRVVNKAVVDGVVQDRNLLGDFLVIPVDPVDFTLTDPNGQKVTATPQGVTAGAGDLRNPFFASDGANTLLIIPNAVKGVYRLDLVGVGPGDFQLGVNYVTAFGQVTTYLLQGALQNGRTEAVLDFQPDRLDGRVEVQTAQANGPTEAVQAGGPSVAAGSPAGAPGPSSTGGARASSAGPAIALPFVGAAERVAVANAVAVLTGLVTGPVVGPPASTPAAEAGDLAGLGGGTADTPGSTWAGALELLDRAFEEWLPAAGTPVAAGVETAAQPALQILDAAASEALAAWRLLGRGAVPVPPELHLDGAAAELRGWLLRAERLAAEDLHRLLHEALPASRGGWRRRSNALPRRPEPGQAAPDAGPRSEALPEDGPELWRLLGEAGGQDAPVSGAALASLAFAAGLAHAGAADLGAGDEDGQSPDHRSAGGAGGPVPPTDTPGPG